MVTDKFFQIRWSDPHRSSTAIFAAELDHPEDFVLYHEGNANFLAALRDAGVRRYLLQSSAFWYAPGNGLADESAPFAFDASPAVAAGTRRYAELEAAASATPGIELVA